MEKRANTRVDFVMEGQVTQAGRTIAGAVTNLSLKGMFFKPQQPLAAAAAQTTIELTVGDRVESLQINGLVVRVIDSGVGIMFDDMDLDTFVLLREVVSRNAGDPETIRAEFEAQVGQSRPPQ